MKTNFFTRFYRTSMRGFTLLETLASIGILSVMVTGPLSVMIHSSAYAKQTKDVMVATYLAQESVELLQNHFDSLYIYCKKNPIATDVGELCEPQSGETPNQTAWRLFKEHLSPVVSPSCYSSISPTGCAFDFHDMTGGATSVPALKTIATCPYLVPVSTSVALSGGAGGQTSYLQLHSYACPTNVQVGEVVDQKHYIRSMKVEQIATFESGPASSQYNDDLRITSNVEFKVPNGATSSVQVVRFMHARE